MAEFQNILGDAFFFKLLWRMVIFKKKDFKILRRL